MAQNNLTDSDKIKLEKLLSDLDVQEHRIPERSRDIVVEFQEAYGNTVVDDYSDLPPELNADDNPYKVDKSVLNIYNDKIDRFLVENKRSQADFSSGLDSGDKPWRINTSREKLLRINNEIRRHREKASLQSIPSKDKMSEIIKECSDMELPNVPPERVQECINIARKNFANYKLSSSNSADKVKELSKETVEDAKDKIDLPGELKDGTTSRRDKIAIKTNFNMFKNENAKFISSEEFERRRLEKVLSETLGDRHETYEVNSTSDTTDEFI